MSCGLIIIENVSYERIDLARLEVTNIKLFSLMYCYRSHQTPKKNIYTYIFSINSNKGHVDADHKGYDDHGGHEEHHEHHHDHGKKGGKEGGSQWGYQKKI